MVIACDCNVFLTILFPVVNPPGNLHSEQLFFLASLCKFPRFPHRELVYYYPYPYPMRVLAWNPSAPLWDARFNGETKLFAASRHLRPEWPEIHFGIWFTWLETNLWDTLKLKKKSPPWFPRTCWAVRTICNDRSKFKFGFTEHRAKSMSWSTSFCLLVYLVVFAENLWNNTETNPYLLSILLNYIMYQTSYMTYQACTFVHLCKHI